MDRHVVGFARESLGEYLKSPFYMEFMILREKPSEIKLTNMSRRTAFRRKRPGL